MLDRTDNKIAISRLLYLYPLLFALSFSQAALFAANQNTKFISGLALAGYRDVAADWMAHITDPFPLFSNLLKWQYQFLGLHAGVHLSFLFLVAVYGASGVLLAKTLLAHDEESRRPLLMFSLIWLLVNTVGIRSLWLGIFPEGLASQYLIGTHNYYQPSCFGVLLFTGIIAYISGRPLWAALLFVVAPLFHPTYLISSLLIATAIILLPANRTHGITLGKRLLFISFVVLVLSIYAARNMEMLTSGDSLIREKAHRILAEVRIPQHSIPSKWNLLKTLMFFIVGSAAGWFGRKQLLGQLLLVMLLVVAVMILWAIIDYNPTVAALAPWRVSVFLAPLSWIVLLTALAKYLTQTSRWRSLFSVGTLGRSLIIVGVAGSLAGISVLAFNYQQKKDEEYYPISRFLAEYHKTGNQYLIPLEQTNIRLEAGVPVYATWKSHPTKDSEFLEWYKRSVAARTIYNKPPDRAESDLLALIASRSVTHVVWPISKGDFPFYHLGQQVYKDNHFSLWDLRLVARELQKQKGVRTSPM